MQIALRPTPKHAHVRGGRIVKVTHAHPVHTSSLREEDRKRDRDMNLPPRWERGARTVPAVLGDLAVEIVSVKTDRVIGHAYLSGHAIGLFSYEASREWFWPGRAGVWSPPEPDRPGMTDQEFAERMALSLPKHADGDVYGFEIVLPPRTHPEVLGTVLGAVARAWEVSPAVETDTVHLIGRVRVDVEGAQCNIHFTPPGASSPYMIGHLHVGLVLSAKGIRNYDDR